MENYKIAAQYYMELCMEQQDLQVNFEEDNYDAGIAKAISEEVPKAFVAGVKWLKKQMDWVCVKDRLPYVEPNEDNSEPVYVIKDNVKLLLTYNKAHECWDDIDGDDYECDIQDTDLWKPTVFPEWIFQEEE